jgi:tetratricopeptide (TPR) repeat protein
MFFPRLRRQAKWMFLFLALVFGLGFVGFGVGAGGIGLGNVFQGAGDTGIPSVSAAEERVAENPNDVQAFRDLATAHQAAGNTDDAIEAYENVIRLRPKEVDALEKVAALYLTKVDEAQRRANEANFRAAFVVPGATVASLVVVDGKPLDPDPITNSVNQRLSETVNAALGEAQQAASSAVESYRRITVATPKDANAQLTLARTSGDAGDAATAIAAYEKFIALRPDDPLVPEIKRIVRDLKQSQATPPVSTSG